MVLAFVVTMAGLEIRTTGAEIRCERGEVSIGHTGLLTGQLTHGISRIQEIDVQFWSGAPQVHTYVDVTDPDAHAPPVSEQPVIEGLSILHHDRRDLLVIKRPFDLVLWVGKVLVEAAKVQGIYCAPPK